MSPESEMASPEQVVHRDAAPVGQVLHPGESGLGRRQDGQVELAPEELGHRRRTQQARTTGEVLHVGEEVGDGMLLRLRQDGDGSCRDPVEAPRLPLGVGGPGPGGRHEHPPGRGHEPLQRQVGQGAGRREPVESPAPRRAAVRPRPRAREASRLAARGPPGRGRWPRLRPPRRPGPAGCGGRAPPAPTRRRRPGRALPDRAARPGARPPLLLPPAPRRSRPR